MGQNQPREDFIRTDPKKVMLPEACGECHRSEFLVWKDTPHAKGYDELHRKQAALKIAESMGFHLVKRESLCLKCHYTSIVRRETLRAAAGVSCESCHGAARDWINLHNVYGVKESDFQKARKLETAKHKGERLRKSEAVGMLRPSNLYAVASNCFQCHTVPHERLVNVGRHSTGSADFELANWTGKIRHNFLESFLTAEGTANAKRPPQRKRVLYFIGRALDLEYSLRGVALARQKGRYVKAMLRRTRNAIGEMREIASRSSLSEASEMLRAVRGVELKPGNSAAVQRAAEAVGEIAKRFLASHDGSELASLDPLYSGDPLQREAAVEEKVPSASVADTGSESLPDLPDSESSLTLTDSKPSGVRKAEATRTTGRDNKQPDTTSQVVSPSPSRKRGAAGRIQRRPSWRPTLQHRTIGPDKCASCHRHSDQDEWWLDDKHYVSADPLLEGERKYLQIARFYGLNASQARRGDQICMQCHGSIVSGKENREVGVGVGCESCHGPGADFREPHQEKNSYQKALRLGMVGLKDLTVRAKTCAGCHYITDPRLISVGHPTGSDFDLHARNSKIQHWEHPLAPPAQLRSAYQNAISERGPIPSVARVATATAASLRQASLVAELPIAAKDAPPDREPTQGVEKPAVKPPLASKSASNRTARADPRPIRAVVEKSIVSALRLAPQDLALFPALDENTKIHEVLLMLKERLGVLYEKVQQEGKQR